MSVRFFLGANSGDGFYSLYDEFACSKGDRLYLIKGGPGCGKSTFMKRLAARAENLGYTVEYILCSGDPESLDGIYIPELKLGFADATAPHVLEPGLFAIDCCYVNLGLFCSWADSDRIIEFTERYKQMYKAAYAFLSAAKTVKKINIPGLFDEKTMKSVQKRADTALRRELGGIHPSLRSSKVTKRFIRGISCMGEVCLTDTVDKLCKRIYIVDDRFGLADIYLKRITEGIAERGDNALICPSPLCPDELDAVLLPEYGLGFVSASVMQIKKPWRHVRLDALVSPEALKAHRAELKSLEKQYRSLLESGIGYLKQAKKNHDLLEVGYKPFIDFAALGEFTEQEVKRLIG